MNSDLIPFQFSGRTVGILIIDGEAWFVASDVARELGYREAYDLTRSLDEDEKGPHTVRTPGGDQAALIISEPGLYRAIVQRRSNKKHDPSLTAKIERFQRWVFHDVLPEIRKTGRYDPAANLEDPAFLRSLLLGYAEKALALQATINKLEPKANFFDVFVDAEGHYTHQNAGKAVGCHPNKFCGWLRDGGYLFYQGGVLTSYTKWQDQGLFIIKNIIGTDGVARPQNFVTAKGIAYFATRVPDSIRLKSRPPERRDFPLLEARP